MTMYARSDIVSITIPAESGGCGSPHIRGIGPDGTSDAVFAVTCGPCESKLETDPMWASSTADVPLTFDEEKAAEQFERIGAQQQAALLTAAVARLAGMAGPEISPVIKGMISGQRALPGPVMVCPAGHAGNVPGARFCAMCGTPMSAVRGPRALEVA
ncbi:MAG: hypothetical protein ACYCVZ_00675 [Streptosporangiaceae bacterium]